MHHSRQGSMFIVFFALYTLINAYIFIHGYRMLGAFGISPIIYTELFLFLALAYIVGEIIQRRKSSAISDFLVTVGAFWLVCIVHFFFASLLYDILRGLNHFLHFMPISAFTSIAYHTTWGVLIGTIIIIALGYINARNPRVWRSSVTLTKTNPVTKSLRLVVATDVHLGAINGRFHAHRLVRMINAQKPDIILFPGDMLDGELYPVIRRDLGRYLKKLTSNYGIFGVIGNHEYIGGIDRAAKYLTDHGITLLRDEAREVAGVTLIGREDIVAPHFGHTRADLATLVKDIDRAKAAILLDHQPKNLQDAVTNGIDIQFSGHTHNGQLWPLNFIVAHLFELPRGYKKKENTHIFVSSGFGTWWPPVRTNARAELLVVDVTFA